MSLLVERNRGVESRSGEHRADGDPARYGPYFIAAASFFALVTIIFPVPAVLTALSSAVYWLAVPGGLWAIHSKWPTVVRLGVTPAIGVAILIALSTAQVWSGIWMPTLWSIIVMLASTVIGLGLIWRQGQTQLSVKSVWARRPAMVTWWNTVFAAAIVAWLFAIPDLRSAPYTQFGLLAVQPRAMAISIVVLIVLFFWAVRKDWLGSAVVALLGISAVLRLTPVLATEAPLYSWTAKHVGVVDVITNAGTLPVGHDIYFSWPGMFTASAWFVATTGIEAVTLAHWFTPMIHIVTMGAMAAVARSAGLRREQVLIAVFLAQILWWVGQDYFSPQAVAMALALGVIACALQGSSVKAPVTKAGSEKKALAAQEATRGAVPWSLLLFAATVVTHQLTPFWLIAGLAALAFFGRVPGVAFWIMAIILSGYTWVNWGYVDQYGAVSSSSPLDNTQAATVTNDPDSERALAQNIYRVIAVSVWFPSLVLGLIALWKRRVWAFPGLAIGFSPFALIVVQTYGGEAVLRVFLYSTAGMAVLLAPLIAKLWTRPIGHTRGTKWRSRLVATAVFAVVLIWGALGSYAYFNTWFGNRVTTAQIDVTNTLVEEIPGPAYISSARGLWPHRGSAGYLERAEERWDFERQLWSVLPRPLPAPADMAEAFEVMMERLETSDVPNYVMFADQSFAEARYDAANEIARLNLMHEFILESPDWEFVMSEGDVEVFRYVPPQAVDSAAATWVPDGDS